jgi:hypothetical protein
VNKLVKYIYVVSILLAQVPELQACRFTIREIGYSQIDLAHYTFHLEVDTFQYKQLVRDFENLGYAWSIEANIKYHIRHEEDRQPTLILKAPSGVVLAQDPMPSLAVFKQILSRLLQSPLQHALSDQMGEAFAFVVCFMDKDEKACQEEVNNACERFQQIASHLDKEVKEDVVQVIISGDERLKERFLLASMGVEPDNKEPVVVVVYGRARMVGKPLIGKEITNEQLFRQLVLLGTDCECGIDISPLLETAWPFSWGDKVRQNVSDMLGFDVDNPLILSEMVQILSRSLENVAGNEQTFRPLTLDLKDDFGPMDRSASESVDDDEQYDSNYSVGLLVLAFAGVVIILIGIYLLKRKG